MDYEARVSQYMGYILPPSLSEALKLVERLRALLLEIEVNNHALFKNGRDLGKAIFDLQSQGLLPESRYSDAGSATSSVNALLHGRKSVSKSLKEAIIAAVGRRLRELQAENAAEIAKAISTAMEGIQKDWVQGQRPASLPSALAIRLDESTFRMNILPLPSEHIRVRIGQAERMGRWKRLARESTHDMRFTFCFPGRDDPLTVWRVYYRELLSCVAEAMQEGHHYDIRDEEAHAKGRSVAEEVTTRLLSWISQKDRLRIYQIKPQCCLVPTTMIDPDTPDPIVFHLYIDDNNQAQLYAVPKAYIGAWVKFYNSFVLDDQDRIQGRERPEGIIVRRVDFSDCEDIIVKGG